MQPSARTRADRVDMLQEHIEIERVRVRVRVLPSGRKIMSRRDAAAYIGRSPKTLANWKSMGIGPPSHTICGREFYDQDDLDAL